MAKEQADSLGGMRSSARESFRREIEHLLGKVPAEQWDDPDVRGVLYEFVPWNGFSSITLQTHGDDPEDIADWKYYFSSESNGSLIRQEHNAWKQETGDKRLVYHRLLIEAAEALLSLDFTKYNGLHLPAPVRSLRTWSQLHDGFCLNKTFLLQVYDVDRTFPMNYCEYVLARRLDTI